MVAPVRETDDDVLLMMRNNTQSFQSSLTSHSSLLVTLPGISRQRDKWDKWDISQSDGVVLPPVTRYLSHDNPLRLCTHNLSVI